MIYRLGFTLVFFLGILAAGAQDEKIEGIEKKVSALLDSEDGMGQGVEFTITSAHNHPSGRVTFVYFQQTYQGIDVHGATGSAVIGEDYTRIDSRALVSDISTLSQMSTLDAPQIIIQKVAQEIDLPFYKSKGRVEKKANGYIITELPYAKDEVTLTPVWVSVDDGYQKGWRVELEPSVSADDFQIITTQNGKVIEKTNYTVYCKFHDATHSHRKGFGGVTPRLVNSPKTNQNVDGAQYRVFPPPLESPLNGDRQLIQNPADPIASPFGWHDVNGFAGADYTITRGNNVHAYQDTSDNDISDMDEPDGGEELVFDFEWNQESKLFDVVDADVTNLFYWNNYVHDWSYKFGFNESAGNFQFNNYGNGGSDGDQVNAQTLDGGDIGNANFRGNRDGEPGRMQMYRWILGNDLDILSPTDLRGEYQTGAASFGPRLDDPIVGNLVLADDEIGERTDACEEIRNVTAIRNNIALIDRGTCDFSFKTFQAQEAGAVATLICNNLADAPLVNMGAGDSANLVNIPALFLSKENCDLIKEELSNQNDVTVRFNRIEERSSSLDNGIVAHEYGHGISLRLVGGARNSGCLSTDEQMGEGWSDFFGLVLTQLPEHDKNTPRGIGVYASGEPVDGPGIRRYRYSFDLSVNPQTHSHIRPSVRPHPLGEIWASALWDMYWIFIEEFGYDPTWTDTESGNYRAIQIVMDGMKLVRCNPGMIDARDALFEADLINYFGENECLIWQAMARRGLGEDADGGLSTIRQDNVDGFQVPLKCMGQTTVQKSMTPFVNAGEPIEVTLQVDNYRSNLSGTYVVDEIPAGTSFISSSFEGEVMVEDNTLRFDLGELSIGQSETISYQLSTEGLTPADFLFFEDFEGQLNFDFTKSSSNIASWSISNEKSSDGLFSLSMPGDTLQGESFAIYENPIIITSANQLLKFDHQIESELGFDGGVIEISENGGISWSAVDPADFIFNGYNDRITYDSRFIDTEFAYTGENGDWQSVVINMSDYVGQEVRVRFRYTQQVFLEFTKLNGWSIDNFEVYDRKELAGTASLFDESLLLSNSHAFTLINSQARTTPILEPENNEFSFLLSPNPSTSFINLDITSETTEEALFQVITSEGRVIKSRREALNNGFNRVMIQVDDLPSGTYVMRFQKEGRVIVEPFVVYRE